MSYKLRKLVIEGLFLFRWLSVTEVIGDILLNSLKCLIFLLSLFLDLFIRGRAHVFVG